jgi:formate dehydrogenase major subunit
VPVYVIPLLHLGMQRTFGTGAATNSIKDIQAHRLHIGNRCQPHRWPPRYGRQTEAGWQLSGKTSIVIDPRRTELAKYATYHLQLRPGTNMAVLNMMLYYIISEGLEDKEFIERRTEGYEEFKQEVLSQDMDKLSEISGVDKDLGA